MNNKEKFFLGYPVNFKNICFLYSPTIKDMILEENLSDYLSLLTKTYQDIEVFFKEEILNETIEKLPTPFEFLLSSAYNNKDVENRLIRALKTLTHEEYVFILYEIKGILFGNIEEIEKIEDCRILQEADFDDFQNLILDMMNKPHLEKIDPNEDLRIKRIKIKARERDAIKQKQAAKEGQSLKTVDGLASICCMGIGITPLNIEELSYTAFNMLINKYEAKEKYDIGIRQLLAGASAKNLKLKYWQLA